MLIRVLLCTTALFGMLGCRTESLTSTGPIESVRIDFKGFTKSKSGAT